jgi:hypothetical protein
LEAHVKRFGLFIVVFLAFGLGGAARCSADDLVVNGSFEFPSLSAGGWTMVPNGTPGFGWATTDTAGDMEIDTPGAIGGSSAYEGSQSLEVNAYNPEDVYQTISGLTPGKTYVLSWAYGDRPGSGDEELQVYFTPTTDLTLATAVATDYDKRNGANSKLLWSPNAVVVTATSTTEVLSFNGVRDSGVTNNGGISYGNEIDAVSLVAAPEPPTLLFFASGLGLLFCAWRLPRPLPVFGRL